MGRPKTPLLNMKIGKLDFSCDNVSHVPFIHNEIENVIAIYWKRSEPKGKGRPGRTFSAILLGKGAIETEITSETIVSNLVERAINLI